MKNRMDSRADVIQVKDLVKRYGKLEAVRGVSFAVRQGEIFGFLGPNGAGKTTTINVLCTLLRPTSGQATVNGYNVLQQRSQVRRSIGLVFQEPTIDDCLTAEQNLRFHAYAYGVPAPVRELRIKEMLTMVELWDRRKSRVRTYSGGMKRRLEIARGLIHHPLVLFLDEPTLGLDPQTRRLIMLVLAPFLGVGLSWVLVLKLIPLLVLVSLSLSGLGLLVASRMRSQQGFQVVMQLLIFPLMFLSGVFFPVNSVPTWLGVIAKANPVTYGVDAIRQVFLGNGAGPVPAGAMLGGSPVLGVSLFGHTMSIAEDMLVVALFGLVVGALAVWSFSQQE